MTIVIPYLDEPMKGKELRYALRSIEKNLSGWAQDHLLIVGKPPDWCKCDYMDVDDILGRKEYSVYRKLLHFCNYSIYQSENFLYWNDDHFLLKPLHVNEIKYWHNGLLGEAAPLYKRVQQKTAITLELLRLPNQLNFDIHVPIIFNKQKFRALFSQRTEELCIKSFYANQCESEYEFMEDLKIIGNFDKQELRDKIKDRLFLSTNHPCQNTFDVLEEMFPNKSRFEL